MGDATRRGARRAREKSLQANAHGEANGHFWQWEDPMQAMRRKNDGGGEGRQKVVVLCHGEESRTAWALTGNCTRDSFLFCHSQPPPAGPLQLEDGRGRGLGGLRRLILLDRLAGRDRDGRVVVDRVSRSARRW